jgi:hypothetical protein
MKVTFAVLLAASKDDANVPFTVALGAGANVSLAVAFGARAGTDVSLAVASEAEAGATGSVC